MTYDIDLEITILAACVTSKTSLQMAEATLKEEYFYKPFHQDIVKAIHKLIRSRDVVDFMTVNGALEKPTEKTRNDLMDLAIKANVYDIRKHLIQLAEYYFKRQLIELCLSNYNNLVGGSDIFETKSNIASGLMTVQNEIEGIKDYKSFSKTVEDVEHQIDVAMITPDHVSGIPTGSLMIDALTGGWQNTDLIVLGARPGMGKTARALSFLKAAVQANKKALFISLEMSTSQLVKRMIAESTGVDLTDLNRGRISQYTRDDIKAAADYLKTLPIVVNDNGRTTIYDISAKCRILKSQDNIDILFVDYLQITKGSKQDSRLSRNDLIGMFTSEFKNIAKECNIPVILLCQLNRGNEGSSEKRPDLQHLRESGSIEQDADIVAFLYRPSYYTKGEQANETDQELRELPESDYLRYSEIIFAKHRNGKLKIIREQFNGSTQQFADYNP